MGTPTAAEIAAMTPMMRQYFELKDRAADAVLFFRMGDFYELFGEQAEEVAPKLEIALTSRERGDKSRIPFCGVPHHSAQAYWLKLLKLGYKVAIADQVEDAAEAKGLVRRDIIKTLTPACIDELEALNADSPNYILALYETPTSKSLALALADLSTAELRLGTLAGPEELLAVVERFKPKELLCRRFIMAELSKLLASYTSQQSLLLSPLPEAVLRDAEEQKSYCQRVLHAPDLSGQPCGPVDGGRELFAALMAHFSSLQASIAQFVRVRPLYEPDTIPLNETVLRDLELFETARTRQTEGSLFREVNACLTPMGARLLRWSLAHPFCKAEPIAERHAGITALLARGEVYLTALRHHLKGLGDLERLSTRVLAKNARPQELGRVRDALQRSQQLLLLPDQDKLLKEAPSLGQALLALRAGLPVLEQLAAALVATPEALGLAGGEGVFRPGYDAELDRFSSFARHGEEKVQAYAEQLKRSAGIASLKIKAHKTFGLVIEVTKSNLSKVPAGFVRRQTMINCERFITAELQELDEALASASERAFAREKFLYDTLLAALASFKEPLQAVAAALAQLDLLQGFAWLALKADYCRPELVAHSAGLQLTACRHPVVEKFVGRQDFIANSLTLAAAKKQMLITGPNMAGKSTLMRQVALCALLNQAGSFVPAQSAVLPIFDGIFTRVGAADDLSRGLSTFMVEMSEAAFVLRHATAKSLVILDEVGRGTSSEDGLAIASAILEHIAERLGCWALFATHYHELVELASKLASVITFQTEVVEGCDGIRFTHRLIPGACASSFGLEVAKLAGVPESIVARAQTFLQAHKQNLSEENNNNAATAKAANATLSLAVPVSPLPTSLQQHGRLQVLSDRLDQIKVNRTTPLQALNILSDLKELLHQASPRSLFQDRQSPS